MAEDDKSQTQILDRWHIPSYLRKEFTIDELNDLKEQFSIVDTSGDGT